MNPRDEMWEIKNQLRRNRFGGIQLMMKTNNQAEEYTRLKEGGTLTKCETVFFANPQDFGAGLPWFLGLLKLEFH